MNRRRRFARRCAIGAVVALLALLTAGCWDQRDIEKRSTVLAITIDRTETPQTGEQEGGGGQSSSGGTGGQSATPMGNATSGGGQQAPPGSSRDLLTIGVEVAVPGGIPLGSAESGGGGGGGAPPVTQFLTTGETTRTAKDNLRTRLNYPTFLGHTRLIAFSEELARDGIFDALNVFMRHSEIRRLLWLVVIQGKASKFLEFKPQLERVATTYVIDMLDDLVRRGRLPNIFFGAFLTKSANYGEDGMVPYLKVTEKDVQVLGMAVFRGGKMVGSIDGKETAAYLEIMGNNTASEEVELNVNGHHVRVRITSRNSSIKPTIVDGKLRMQVDIEVEANVWEVLAGFNASRPDNLKEIAKSLQGDVKRRSEDLVKKVQGWNSDIFGFGEYVRAKMPSEWNPDTWHETFGGLPVDITVEATIRRIGMLNG